jgi:hypothetical protein
MSRIGQLYSKKELAAIDKKDYDTLQRYATRHFRSAAIRKIVKAGNPNVRKALKSKLRAIYNRLKRRRRKK